MPSGSCSPNANSVSAMWLILIPLCRTPTDAPLRIAYQWYVAQQQPGTHYSHPDSMFAIDHHKDSQCLPDCRNPRPFCAEARLADGAICGQARCGSCGCCRVWAREQPEQNCRGAGGISQHFYVKRARQGGVPSGRDLRYKRAGPTAD